MIPAYDQWILQAPEYAFLSSSIDAKDLLVILED